ncbi:MFS transporter [Subtercola frigoramans]|uniref:MFS family permease n=1 Tax=Subtercola frigoramans TaxID=120298 RepID=A0ABS2L019_9MICO|nr:MFS transporter [Subtercola frigoramans]MBM7470422.1 MFS family permease [Subtercola frigoramans]
MVSFRAAGRAVPAFGFGQWGSRIVSAGSAPASSRGPASQPRSRPTAIRFFGSYADILRVPGARSFVLAGWLGRVSRSTAGVATILLVAAFSGSFALSGAVSGAIILGIAVGGPLWARAVDARGQRLVLPFSLAAAAVAAAALVSLVLAAAPIWTWFVAAFVLGASSIDVGSLVRSRWRTVVFDEPGRHTSLALESVSDELVFVIGPPAVVVIAATAGPISGFAAAFAVSIVGGLWLWLQRSTTPSVAVRESRKPGDAAAAPSRPRTAWYPPAGVLSILPVFAGVGAVFTAIDLAAVGVGREAGQPWLTGVTLAVLSVGSVVAAFAFGPLSALWRPTTRVVVSTVAYAIVVPSLLLVRDPAVLAGVVVVAGLVTTPVLISGTSFIAARAPEGRLTEALTWPSIGMAAGATVSGALTGIVIDAGSVMDAFWVAAAAAVIVGMVGVGRALRDRSTSSRVGAGNSLTGSR